MGSTVQQKLEERMVQHGQFPISARRSIDESVYRSVAVFEPDDFGALDMNLSSHFVETVKTAWAALLQSYIRSSCVSFAVVPAKVSNSAGKEILHYRLSGDVELGSLHAIDTGASETDQLRHVDVNTAIVLPLPYLSRKDQVEVGSNTKMTGKLEHFVLVLHVRASIFDTTLYYGHPIISTLYAHAIAHTFRDICMAIFEHGSLQMGQLDTISYDDYQKMAAWNPQDPFCSMEDSCMHHLVEAKVCEMPSAEAVCAWNGSLTYNRLDVLANLAAQRLVEVGVGPGVYVPFAYEKGMWTVVATLAILKAGGAFVPVNPRDPETRLSEILNKVDADVVVTTENFVPLFQKLVKHVIVVSAETLGLKQSRTRVPLEELKNNEMPHGGSGFSDFQSNHEDHEGAFSSNPKADAPPPNGAVSFRTEEVRPSDPIFVLFTSGSTGQPKGMILEHSAICTHALVHGSKMGYQSARVLQFAAHTFDVAIMDIFTTLLFGGCICIPSEEERRSNIVGVINNMTVDYAILTPSFAGLIDPSEVPTLKTLAVGGEALPQDRVQRWAEHVNLIQIYGPAEVGICHTMDMKLNTAPETVGYPLCNSSCWLVDPDNHDTLVPIGAVGELMVAGPSLARGYLNNEAKTRASFIERPAWAIRLGLKCERFYLTGDLLRYNTNSFDGAYDIVGRKDAQIKLRGQRIEPAEIEYHIGKLPDVAASMVTRPKKGCFVEELVCVVQTHCVDSTSSRVLNEPIRLASSQADMTETLRNYLSKLLPSFMIPSTCVCIESMPFVPSLKIDRRQVDAWLMELESRPVDLHFHFLAPLLPTETTALTLSLEVSEMIARKDERKRMMLAGHDFELQEVGIDSIQIISLSMLLQRQHSTKIPMNALLSPEMTVRKLASLIGEHQSPSTSSHLSVSASGIAPLYVDVGKEVRTRTESLFRSIEKPVNHLAAKMNVHQPRQNILLTGATGYLGSAILHRLLSNPNITIYTLVRCPSPSTGLERIINAAKTYKWWHPSYLPRIHIWQGDLTLPNLSLGASQLQMLCGTSSTSCYEAIHTIIHNGARVHYSSSYTSLTPPNIKPTMELLRITAQSSHISHFTFVSGGLKPNLSPQLTSSSDMKMLSKTGGYGQTKFVSETLVHHCASHPFFQGKGLRIVKPGYIIGTPEAGVANRTDFLWRLVAGCAEIGAVNKEELGRWVFVGDMGSVAGRVVDGVVGVQDAEEGSGGNNLGPGVGNIDRVLCGLRFADLWALLREKFGYRLDALPYEDWIARLKAKILEKQEKHLLFPLLHVLEKDGNCIGEEFVLDGEGETRRVMEAVEKNLRWLVEVGFLPKAGRGGFTV